AAAALLDAYEATGDDQWLRRAVAIMHHCGRAHWDDAAGGFFDIARDQGGPAYLATPAKPVQDSPTPSGNGAAALVLARLWALTDDAEWRRLLDRQLESFAGAAAELSLHGATLLRAIDWALNPVTRIEVAGPRGAGAACTMHLVGLQAYRPRTVVLRKTADPPGLRAGVQLLRYRRRVRPRAQRGAAGGGARGRAARRDPRDQGGRQLLQSRRALPGARPPGAGRRLAARPDPRGRAAPRHARLQLQRRLRPLRP